MYTVNDFKVGDRVEVHPATDRWMMGDRYATVTRVGTKRLTLHFDRSNSHRPWSPTLVQNIVYQAPTPFTVVGGFVFDPASECMCDFEGNSRPGCDHS